MANIQDGTPSHGDCDMDGSGHNEREATELTNVAAVEGEGISCNIHSAPASAVPQAKGYFISFGIPVKSFWRRQVSPTVSHEACRDHLGTLCLLM